MTLPTSIDHAHPIHRTVFWGHPRHLVASMAIDTRGCFEFASSNEAGMDAFLPSERLLFMTIAANKTELQLPCSKIHIRKCGMRVADEVVVAIHTAHLFAGVKAVGRIIKRLGIDGQGKHFARREDHLQPRFFMADQALRIGGPVGRGALLRLGYPGHDAQQHKGQHQNDWREWLDHACKQGPGTPRYFSHDGRANSWHAHGPASSTSWGMSSGATMTAALAFRSSGATSFSVRKRSIWPWHWLQRSF